jgi:hypothetical protein
MGAKQVELTGTVRGRAGGTGAGSGGHEEYLRAGRSVGAGATRRPLLQVVVNSSTDCLSQSTMTFAPGTHAWPILPTPPNEQFSSGGRVG